MAEVYYQAIEGEQQVVTLCVVLYQGRLKRNLTVLLTTLKSSLGETGMILTLDILMRLLYIRSQTSYTWARLCPTI